MCYKNALAYNNLNLYFAESVWAGFMDDFVLKMGEKGSRKRRYYHYSFIGNGRRSWSKELMCRN